MQRTSENWELTWPDLMLAPWPALLALLALLPHLPSIVVPASWRMGWQGRRLAIVLAAVLSLVLIRTPSVSIGQIAQPVGWTMILWGLVGVILIARPGRWRRFSFGVGVVLIALAFFMRMSSWGMWWRG